jgi:hypothetical protein
VKYFFFVLALMHAPVSLSAESALPPAQRPAFAPAKRSSKDMGKPGTNNCENSSVGRVKGPHVAGGDRFECGHSIEDWEGRTIIERLCAGQRRLNLYGNSCFEAHRWLVEEETSWQQGN